MRLTYTDPITDCKNLAPIWENLASTFAGDKNSVVIAKVDAEAPNSKKTAADYGVKSYPTIKFFAKGDTKGEDYSGARSEPDFVNFINDKAGTHRVPGGGLDATAGTIAALDSLVAKFTSKQNTLAQLGEELTAAAATVKDTYAAYYLKVVEKLTKSEGYVEKETKRLASLLKKGGLSREKADDLAKRANILIKFKQQIVGKDEL